MTYALLIIIIIALIRLWLTATVKKAVVQPVRDNKLLDPPLSEKPRWKAIKEDHGLAIGFWAGLLICIIIYWNF